jgi:hypothetical protein
MRYYTPMNIQKIRKQVTGGFAPFVLHTSNGREFKVPHPEFIFLTKNDVVVMDAEGDAILLDPLHVVAIKSLKSGKTTETSE